MNQTSSDRQCDTIYGQSTFDPGLDVCLVAPIQCKLETIVHRYWFYDGGSAQTDLTESVMLGCLSN